MMDGRFDFEALSAEKRSTALSDEGTVLFDPQNSASTLKSGLAGNVKFIHAETKKPRQPPPQQCPYLSIKDAGGLRAMWG